MGNRVLQESATYREAHGEFLRQSESLKNAVRNMLILRSIGVRFFRGLSEAIIRESLTVEILGDVEDLFFLSASPTLFQSSVGRSTSVAWVKDLS